MRRGERAAARLAAAPGRARLKPRARFAGAQAGDFEAAAGFISTFLELERRLAGAEGVLSDDTGQVEEQRQVRFARRGGGGGGAWGAWGARGRGQKARFAALKGARRSRLVERRPATRPALPALPGAEQGASTHHGMYMHPTPLPCASQLLLSAKQQLEGVVAARLEEAAGARDHAAVMRFVKLYKPLGNPQVGARPPAPG